MSDPEAAGAQKDGRRSQRRRLLASVSIFSDLDDKALDALLEATALRRLAPRELLFRKGDPGLQLYGVLEGRIKISTPGTDGREVVFGFSEPGDVIGDIALLDSNPRSASAIAVERSELLTLDRRDFLPFLERHPRVAIHLSQVLAARTRRLSEHAEDAMFLALPSRLAKRLLGLAEHYGQELADGTLIDLRLQQQELGDMVGTSRESINKQLRAWVSDGFVKVERGYITLLDREALATIAQLTLA